MSEETVVFGIKNCDSVKQARQWLDTRGVTYRFHDLRVDGLSKDQLQAWLDQIGPEQLINTRSATWRQLGQNDQAMATGRNASAIVLTNPTLIKRPLLQHKDTLTVGFTPEVYEEIFR